MNLPINLQDENPKRAAFKRFSQIGAAGLAVISMSAFADVSAKQLPANVEKVSIEKQTLPLENLLTKKTTTADEEILGYYDAPSLDWPYSDNYTNYNNHYGNYTDVIYSNNYANYCNAV